MNRIASCEGILVRTTPWLFALAVGRLSVLPEPFKELSVDQIDVDVVRAQGRRAHLLEIEVQRIPVDRTSKTTRWSDTLVRGGDLRRLITRWCVSSRRRTNEPFVYKTGVDSTENRPPEVEKTTCENS